MFRKIAALVAPALLFTACAQEADSGAVQVSTAEAAVTALRSAPDAAADARTGQLEMVVEVSPPEAEGEPFEITASGSFDLAAEQMSMTMDMGALFDRLAESSDEPVPPGLGGDWDVRVDGDTFYLRVPILQMFTGTDGWLSMTANDVGAAADGFGLGAGTYDPSKILDSLRGVRGEPEVVGEEEVRGVATTHYRATIDVERAVAQAPEEQRTQVEAALEQLGDPEIPEIPVDIWLDDDGLPRRLSIDLGHAPAGVLGDAGAMTLTMEVFGYGEPVDIEIPSADEVTPFRDVAGNLEVGS
jgi:hypothetical protein